MTRDLAHDQQPARGLGVGQQQRLVLADGFVSGGTRRNLDWVRAHTDLSAVSEDEALLLADAQTSGGLLLAGEVPGAPVIGEFVPQQEFVLVVR